MTANTGTIDRAIRAVLGLALIVVPFVLANPMFESAAVTYGAVAVGVILLGTALVKFCPLYALFGIRTCRV